MSSPLSSISFPLSPMSESPNYLALHNAYQLCAILLRDGLTPDTLPYAQSIEPLAAVLPSPFDADIAASQHYALFEEAVYPFQSIFLDKSNLIGGDVAETLYELYAALGFETTALPDHIATELECLAWLCAAAAETEGPAIENMQLALLTEIGRWIVPFSMAMKRNGTAFYQALADFVLLAVENHPLFAALPDPAPLAAVPDILADDKTRLGDISTFLLTPLHSGVYLAPATIQGIGRKFNLPIGFGTRNLMLTNVFRQGAHYNCVDEVWQTLADYVAQWIGDYETQNAKLAAPWLARAIEMQALITKLRAATLAMEDTPEA